MRCANNKWFRFLGTVRIICQYVRKVTMKKSIFRIPPLNNSIGIVL